MENRVVEGHSIVLVEKPSYSSKISRGTPIIGIRESGIGSLHREGDWFMGGDKNVDHSEQTIPLQKVYDNAYLRFPIVTAAVDKHAEQVVQEISFEGPDKEKLQRWADAIELDIKLYITVKQMVKNGGQFVEFPKKTEWKFLDPKYMTIHRKRTGDVIGYTQEIDGRKIALWGTTGEKDLDEKYAKKAPFENMVYFPFNQLPGDKYGTSIIHSIIPSLMLKEQMDRDSQIILRRYSAPIIHVKMGDEMHLPSDSDITSAKNDLKDIYADTEYVTNHLTEMKVLGFDGKGLDVSKHTQGIMSDILVGLQTPEELLPGFQGSEGKGSEVALRSWGRHIKFIQRQLKSIFENRVIQGVLGMSTKNKINFGFVEEREEEIYFDKIRGLVKDGVITPQKGNDLLPPKFRETLPMPDSNPSVDQAKRSAKQDQYPNQKGPDSVKDNPNDPSKKQENGVRRDKKLMESLIILKDGTEISGTQIKEMHLV